MKFVQFYIFIFILFVASCTKEEFIGPEIIDDAIAEEVLTANQSYSQIYQIVTNEIDILAFDESLALMADSLHPSSVNSCADVIYHLSDDGEYVSDLTIIYSDSSCELSETKKNGSLKVHLDGPFDVVGSEMIILPDGFYLNENRIEGAVKIKSEGFNPFLQFVFSEQIIDGKITINDFKSFTWNSNSEILIDFFEDKLIYSPSARGLSRTGRGYSVKSLIPLTRTSDCVYFQTGELKLTSPWGLDQRLYYGDGDCDDEAELWQNESHEELLIP